MPEHELCIHNLNANHISQWYTSKKAACLEIKARGCQKILEINKKVEHHSIVSLTFWNVFYIFSRVIWENTDFIPQCEKKKIPRIKSFFQKYLLSIYYVSHIKNEKPFLIEFTVFWDRLCTLTRDFCVQSDTWRRSSVWCHILYTFYEPGSQNPFPPLIGFGVLDTQICGGLCLGFLIYKMGLKIVLYFKIIVRTQWLIKCSLLWVIKLYLNFFSNIKIPKNIRE